jgi:hypothetical protein
MSSANDSMHKAPKYFWITKLKRTFSGAHSSPMAGYGFGLGKFLINNY